MVGYGGPMRPRLLVPLLLLLALLAFAALILAAKLPTRAMLNSNACHAQKS